MDNPLTLNIPSYNDLYGLVKKEAYPKLLNDIQQGLLNAFRKQKRIRIGFQVSLLSEWIGDDIVRRFMVDHRFKVDVILVWETNTDKEREFKLLKEHFTAAKIPFRIADGSVKPAEYDIMFFTLPYLEALDKFTDKGNPIYHKTLICYTAYGIYVANIQNIQYNRLLHNICWKNYVHHNGEFAMGAKYCDIGAHAMVNSGYPKMDILYDPGLAERAEWKIAGNGSVKKIIYAPHHSINELPHHSTFPQNYRFILDYAKAHADTTSWIFKPHPTLKFSAVKNGVFASAEEFQVYCDEWDSLPNARYEDGEYLHWFKTSDAMIFDSMSFLAEYLYVDKPGLFLTREGSKLNEFGELCQAAYYQAAGNDHKRIAEFIEQLIDKDELKDYRRKLFDKFLDYRKKNGVSAAEFIYNDICDSIWKKKAVDNRNWLAKAFDV